MRGHIQGDSQQLCISGGIWDPNLVVVLIRVLYVNYGSMEAVCKQYVSSTGTRSGGEENKAKSNKFRIFPPGYIFPTVPDLLCQSISQSGTVLLGRS